MCKQIMDMVNVNIHDCLHNVCIYSPRFSLTAPRVKGGRRHVSFQRLFVLARLRFPNLSPLSRKLTSYLSLSLCFSSFSKRMKYWLSWVSEDFELNSKHLQKKSAAKAAWFIVCLWLGWYHSAPTSQVLCVHRVNVAVPGACDAAAGMGVKPLKLCLMGPPSKDPGQSELTSVYRLHTGHPAWNAQGRGTLAPLH